MAVLEESYTNRWKLLSLVVLAFFLVFSGKGQVFALNGAAEREDLWVCPGAEIAMFSISRPAYGGGMTLGYGSGASIGIKAAYLLDPNGRVSTLELNFLLRFYFLGATSCSGPYIQINGGPAFFAKNYSLAFPSEFGVVSAGLSLGWRFLIGQYFFIEPTVRGGYPYIVGGGLFAGFHF